MLASVLSYLRAGGLLLLAATLTACGGGGGAGGGGFVNSPIGGDSSSASYSLTIVTLNPDGDASLQVTSEAPLTVNVQLKGSDGSTPSNELISLATTIASVDPANGTAVTNETGVATFTLTFNGTEGAGSVQASYSADGNTVTSSINIESVLVKEARLLSLNTTNSQGVTSNELSAVDPMTVALTLTEADGSTPVPDALLSLTSTVGTVAPGSGSALTDELGVARFTVSNPVQEGAGVLVGRYQSETLSLTIQKNIQAVASSDVYSLSFEEVPNVGVVTDKSPIAVTVQLTSSNQSEYPVANQIITINSSLVSIEPPNGRVRTDADGKASFSISYRGIIGAGTLQAGFSSNGESASAITAIETQLEANTSTPGAVVALSLNTFDPDGTPTREFSAVQPLTVTVQIVDAFGDPVDVDGEVISLAADVGSVSPSNGSVVTSGGLASFTLDFNGIVGAGLAEASLTIDNTSYVGSIAIQAISETPYLVSLERSPGPLTRVNPITVAATVTKLDGSPVDGGIVNFESDLGTLTPASAVTGADGIAETMIEFTDESGAGTLTATYSVNGEDFSNQFNFDSVVVDPPYELSFQLVSDGVDVSALGRFTDLDPLDVTVTLVDEAGDPVAGERVALETSIGSVNTPANAEAVTDANGEALFSVVSDGASGAGTLTATYASMLGDVTANKNIQSVVADDVYNLVITSITDNGVIQDGQPITVSAELTSTDLANYPVRFQNIDASTTIGNIAANGGALASTATGRTDASGRVEFTVAYGGVVGAGTVTVSFTDAPNGQASDSANIVVENPLLNLNLQVTTGDTLGAATRQFDADNPLVVDVEVVDDTGLVVDIDNVAVTLETTIGEIAAPASTLVQDGVASFVLLYDGTVGAGEITATYGDQAPLLQQRVAVEATAAEPYSVVLTTSGGNLSLTNDLDLTATVTRGGVPIEAEIVSFSSTIGALSADAGVTTAAGEATSTLSYDGTPGAGTVTASIDTDIGMFNKTVAIQAVAEAIPYTLSFQPLTELDGVTANNQLSAETSLLVTVELLEGAAGLENRVVVLETDSTLATVMPDNGAALTDDNGQATFLLTYGGSTGAGTLVARYDGTMGTVSDEETFESIVNPVEIGSLDDNGDFVDNIIRVEPSTTVGYLGSVELLFAVGNNIGERLISTQSIRVDSPCLLNGFASLSTDSIIELTDGIGTSTYTVADACSDTTDEVTATLVQAGNSNPASASTTLSLSAAPAADERFITFISATPANIALQGTGGGVGLEERAQVTFEVRDGSGNPVAGQEVTFELSRTTGGLTLADVSDTTDASGRVAATVISGTIATPVRVIATTERSPADLVNDPISVVSDSLTVSSGIVTQARFSVGVDTFNPAAAADINGISVTLTATAYDRFGNAVPNGTAVNFTSECGGIVDPENGGPRGACETVNGSCRLEWRSQPAADTVCADNRVTIMAHALGEEAFSDDNGDGYYTNGESFSDNSEAFRNDNESRDVDGPTYDAGELFIDLDNDSSFSEATPIANAPAGLYNGIACISDSTVCSSDAISVFSNIEIVAGPLDANSLIVTVEDAAALLLDPAVDPMVPGSYVVRVTDTDGNVPPKGTVISTSSTGECGVATPAATMSNSNTIGAFEAGVGVIAVDANEPDTSDTITIAVTIPVDAGGSGNSRNFVFACNL